MGASISAGLGMEKARETAGRSGKVFSFIGDSTFFHSGITGLIDSIYNNIPIVTVILDNRTTGMTGHQENPGTGRTLQGKPAAAIDIESVVLALGIKKENIRKIDPYNLEETNRAVKDAHESLDPFVIIAKQECALLKSARAKRAKTRCIIETDKCRKCKACLNTGCPAISFKDNVVSIDENTCNGCSLCLQVCKFGAISKVGELNE